MESAVFTEPDDQSAWWYYHFLIDAFVVRAVAGEDGPVDRECSWLLEAVRSQKDAMTSLHEMEPRSKWVLMAIIMLIDAAATLTPLVSDDACGSEAVAEGMKEEREAALTTLCAMDPLRVRSYLHRLAPH